jgi:hypothetical protein
VIIVTITVANVLEYLLVNVKNVLQVNSDYRNKINVWKNALMDIIQMQIKIVINAYLIAESVHLPFLAGKESVHKDISMIVKKKIV